MAPGGSVRARDVDARRPGSLGVTLHEMLSGRSPFAAPGRRPAPSPPSWPTRLRRSGLLGPVVRRCLEKDPAALRERRSFRGRPRSGARGRGPLRGRSAAAAAIAVAFRRVRRDATGRPRRSRRLIVAATEPSGRRAVNLPASDRPVVSPDPSVVMAERPEPSSLAPSASVRRAARASVWYRSFVRRT